MRQSYSESGSEELLVKNYTVKMQKDRATVLFVDDDPDHLLLYSLLMERGGYKTVLASSAQEGLKILHETPVDVVISDVRMPGVSGRDFVKFLRKSPSYRNIPVIMLTASNEKVEDDVLKPTGPDLICNKDQAQQMLLPQIKFLLS